MYRCTYKCTFSTCWDPEFFGLEILSRLSRVPQDAASGRWKAAMAAHHSTFFVWLQKISWCHRTLTVVVLTLDFGLASVRWTWRPERWSVDAHSIGRPGNWSIPRTPGTFNYSAAQFTIICWMLWEYTHRCIEKHYILYLIAMPETDLCVTQCFRDNILQFDDGCRNLKLGMYMFHLDLFNHV